MQDATQVSVFTTAAPGTDVCTLSRSYGYSQAQASVAGDTYLLYTRLETPSKGNVVLAAAAPGTAFTSASLKGTVLQGQGNQTIVIGATTY